MPPRTQPVRPTGILLLLSVLMLLVFGTQGAEYSLKLPLGLQEQAAYLLEDNPLTPEKIALGKQFFWDKRWSQNGTVACMSCHDPNHGWADPPQFSTRFDGKPTPRHSPTPSGRSFQIESGLLKEGQT